MKVNTNVQGLRTTNHMSRLQNASGKVMEKLSSGLSINRAADNASGLAISEKMRAQIRGLAQADRNIQDAKSLMNTAESGLGNITDMMQRMRELTISSLNDTYTELDRQLINEEFNQLKHAIDSATKHSEWSGKPVIDNHSPAYNEIQGNHVFPKSTAVRIISGLNDDLTITIDGIPRTVKLPEGEYEPVDILIDILDDLLIEIDPNLIAHVTEDRTISIQAENSQSIDHIKGGASFLLYEYIFGNPPGMIIGSTQYEGADIEIIKGKSDTLTFHVGNDREYTFVFDEGKYSKEELLETINEKLLDAGETDVEAKAYGDKYIAITSNKYVITGVGGNMIEIDGITSILYDNRQSGSVSKTNATVSGYKNLQNGVEFKKGVNDQLNIYIEGNHIAVDFLNASQNDTKLTANQIISKINDAFKSEGVQAEATLNNSNQLVIKSKYYGSASQVTIDAKSSAFDDLFVRHETIEENIIPTTGKNAVLQGYFGIASSTEITSANNKLTGTIGNQSFEIVLAEKSYTKQELINALNEKAQNLSIEFSFANTTQDGKSAIIVKNTSTNESFSLDKTDLYTTLTKGIRVESPIISQGTTTENRSPEGIAKPPTYDYKPAVATGRSSLNNLEITNSNNVLAFKVNGELKTIHLTAKVYQTAEEFITEHKAAFENAGVIASSNSAGQLILTTKEAGQGETLSTFSGNAYESIMGRKVESVPANSAASASYSGVKGFYKVPQNYVINSSNDELSFQYTENGTSHQISIKLEQKTYVDHQSLINEIQSKIDAILPNEIEVSIDSLGRLSLQAKNAGEAYSFSNIAGSFFKEAFQKNELTYEPQTSRSGTFHAKETYIVGRDIIENREFIIHPQINDLLYFDFKHDNQTIKFEIKLPAGSYSTNQLIAELNKGLKSELEKHGYANNFIQVEMGGIRNDPNRPGQALDEPNKLVFKVNVKDDGRNDSGSYVIDSIRGTAAYTFFYPSEGDPEPSYTIGVKDLFGGATIIEGKNDTFIVDVDNKEKKMVLPPGDYSAEALLEKINEQLSAENAGIIASYFEGKLKLSTTETGQIPIDGIRGNARGTLFYETETRKDDQEWTFQTGPNSGNNVTMDKARTSAKLLRINTLMIDDPTRAEKALQRLDDAIKTISRERSKIGAYTNRLDHAMNSVRMTNENLTRSESLIRDTDIAKQMMEKVKNDLLLAANQTVIAHVNNQPGKVLELLR